MDLTSALGSVFAAVGLAGAAGLNAWLPLFASALLDRLGVVELTGSFEQLSTTPGLIALGVLLVADFVGDKIPVVDHALHALGGVLAPLSGAILFTGPTGAETEIPTWGSLLGGGVLAGAVHLGRAGLRPVSTAATGGTGNPVVSFLEDIGSAVLTAAAFLLPILACLAVLGLLVAALLLWRRGRRALSHASRGP